MDINGFTTGIERPDGSFINVEVEPVNVEIEGHLKSTGVYNLYNSHFGDDMPRARSDADYMGALTFSQTVEGEEYTRAMVCSVTRPNKSYCRLID